MAVGPYLTVVAALHCVASLTSLPVPNVIPIWLDRPLTAEERAHTNRPTNAIGAYFDVGPGVIVAEEWSVLVHEGCHHMQRFAGQQYREPECERVQREASNCPQ